jgi:hypothetical protein
VQAERWGALFKVQCSTVAVAGVSSTPIKILAVLNGEVGQMFNFVKRFSKEQDGGTLIAFTLTLPFIIGALGVFVEAGYWMKSKKDLHLVADMAAHSGAMELIDFENAAAVTSATLDALQNGYDYDMGNITVNVPPTSGSYAGGKAVEVIIEQKGEQYFSSFFGENKINYKVRSVAAVTGDDSICLLALNTTERGAFELTGSSSTDIAKCSIASNSSHGQGARIAGTATVNMECMQAVGGIYEGNTTTVTHECLALQSGTDPINDPYADMVAPNLATYPSVCSTPASISSNEWAMSPGRYCADMDFNELVRMSPGLYVLDGAQMKFNGSAELQGTGVTIVLMNRGEIVSINGSSHFELSAPLTGDYKGVLIFSDPDTQRSTDTIKINGDSSSSFDGLLYFPTQDIEFGGNSSSGASCTLVVADTISLSGNAEFETTDCITRYGLEIPGNIVTKIVE